MVSNVRFTIAEGFFPSYTGDFLFVVIYVNEKKLCSSKGTKADNSSFYWNKSFTFEAGNSDKLLLKAISQNGDEQEISSFSLCFSEKNTSDNVVLQDCSRDLTSTKINHKSSDKFSNFYKKRISAAFKKAPTVSEAPVPSKQDKSTSCLHICYSFGEALNKNVLANDCVLLKLVSARDLNINIFEDKSYFCIIEIATEIIVSSRVQSSDRLTNWNEVFLFNIPPVKTFKILVFNSEEDLLGHVNIQVSSLSRFKTTESTENLEERWYNLEENASFPEDASPSLLLGIFFRPALNSVDNLLSLSKSSAFSEEFLPVPTLPESESRRWALNIKILSATDLRLWPLYMIPRSYVIIRVANTKAQTASIGNVIEFGGQDHASPVWNEVFCLSAETFASCTLKVYTATQNHITDAVFHHQIGRCVFALDSLPFCDECLNEDCSDAERNAVRVELRANQPITSQDREKLLQKDNPKKLPALLDCYLAIPKNSPKDIMKIRSKRQGAPRLTVLAALVPAMDVCGGLDEGGEESAEDPKISPIELPKPFEWLLIDEEFPCSVTKLKNLLFGDASLFLLKFYETQKYKEVFVGDWCAQSGSSAQDCRTVTYMMPSTSFMKSLKATELQKYEVQAPGGCVVEIQSLTPNAPMASTFEVHVQLCLNKLTPKRALLRASAETRFVKSTLLKGQIEKTVKKGLEETYTNLAKTLRGLFGGPRKKKKITEAPTFWLFRNVTISISQLLGGLVVVVLLAVLNLYSFYFIFFKENNAVLQ